MNYSVLYTESVSDSILLDIFNWKYEGILLRIYDSSKLGLHENTMLTNLDNKLVVIRVNHLVYLSEVLMEHLELTCFELMYIMVYRFRLEYMNELLINSRKDLYLNWRITSNMVINNERKWFLLNENVMA